MIGATESAEIQNSHRVIDLATRAHEKERNLPDEIRVKGNQIGASLWVLMLEMTAQDGLEKGLTVSRSLSGKITTSEISQGQIVDGIPKVDYPPPPLLNYGISHVHTHPPLRRVNPNAPTTMMGNNDCSKFFKHKFFAGSVMLDEGGVHLLLREKPIMPNRPNFPNDAADQAIKESNGFTLDAMKRLAVRLEKFGIRYYFSPSKELLPDGTLALKDVRTYSELSPSKTA